MFNSNFKLATNIVFVILFTQLIYSETVNAEVDLIEKYFLKHFSKIIENEDYINRFYIEIIGKDINEFNLQLESNDKYFYHSDKEKNTTNRPFESFDILSLWRPDGKRRIYLKFNKNYKKITALDVHNFLGKYDRLKSNFVPRFYNDCTFGYHNETFINYSLNKVNIIFKFNTNRVVSEFYAKNNITKIEDDPEYEKLREFLSIFSNIEYAELKEIEILQK